MINLKVRTKGLISIAVLLIIAISVYIGFEPLIELVPEGIAQSVVFSSFGAIFVIILTMYLLNKQTEVEQESKRSERIFDEKIKLFLKILDIIEEMLEDSSVTHSEISKLPFPLIQLCMLCGEKPITAFQKVNSLINDIYNRSENETVEISKEDRSKLIGLLVEFANECRTDLKISDGQLSKTLKKNFVETISKTGTRPRDYQKFSFKGKEYFKNRYVHAVIKNIADKDHKMSLKKFAEIIPQNTKFKTKIWVTLEEALEQADKGRKRHFIEEHEQIILSDATICVTNGQSIDTTKKFIEFFKEKNLEIE